MVAMQLWLESTRALATTDPARSFRVLFGVAPRMSGPPRLGEWISRWHLLLTAFSPAEFAERPVAASDRMGKCTQREPGIAPSLLARDEHHTTESPG